MTHWNWNHSRMGKLKIHWINLFDVVLRCLIEWKNGNDRHCFVFALHWRRTPHIFRINSENRNRNTKRDRYGSLAMNGKLFDLLLLMRSVIIRRTKSEQQQQQHNWENFRCACADHSHIYLWLLCVSNTLVIYHIPHLITFIWLTKYGNRETTLSCQSFYSNSFHQKSIPLMLPCLPYLLVFIYVCLSVKSFIFRWKLIFNPIFWIWCLIWWILSLYPVCSI